MINWQLYMCLWCDLSQSVISSNSFQEEYNSPIYPRSTILTYWQNYHQHKLKTTKKLGKLLFFRLCFVLIFFNVKENLNSFFLPVFFTGVVGVWWEGGRPAGAGRLIGRIELWLHSRDGQMGKGGKKMQH